MKEAVATITVFIVVGAIIWNQLPSDDNTVIVDEYEENVSTWLDAGPEIPSSTDNPEVDNMFDMNINGQKEGPFAEKFALARQVLGPDGLFTWQGREYTCMHKEELEALINEAIEDTIDDVVKHSVQIVETILPVQDIGDSTSINIDVQTFKP